MFRLDEDVFDEAGLLVVPRLIGRSREVVRSIVEIRHDGDASTPAVTVSIPEQESDSAVKQAGRRTSITEQSYFEEISRNASPQVADLVRSSMDYFVELGLEIQWASRGPQIRYIPEAGARPYITLFQLHIHGTLRGTGRLTADTLLCGLSDDIWKPFLTRMTELIPDTELLSSPTKIYGNWTWLVIRGGGVNSAPRMEPLVEHKQEWFDAVESLVQRLDSAFDLKNGRSDIAARD
jgi:hypothetical protein